MYKWFKFYFPLFWGMVMYDNEFKTNGNNVKSKPRIKLNHNTYTSQKGRVTVVNKFFNCHTLLR